MVIAGGGAVSWKRLLLPQEAPVATVTALTNHVWDSFRCEPRPDPVPDARDSSDVGGSRRALVAMVIAATGPTRTGRAASRAFATSAGHSARMRSSLTPLGPPVSRDRIITSFPKWYTPDACLQLKEHFHGQVSTTCQRRNTGTVGLRLSKVVVVGDLYVGKTSLIHRFCKNVFDRDYKATIGVDFEIERFEIAGIPYSLQIWDTAGQEKFKCIASAYYRGAQVIITAFDLTDVQTLEHTRQWLEDALRENEPGSCFVFLVGTKKDLLSGAACEQAEVEAVRLANEMKAEYWSVSAKTGGDQKYGQQEEQHLALCPCSLTHPPPSLRQSQGAAELGLEYSPLL
ncbi:ras-related protein Rab-36 isoform X4 [Mustela erminea]|uniref:ras-related protein Rab-36 isoform X4 n=1 Tax=Mustela erminea TaxID=36723 RepID=UPI0013867C7D|nr:ras-related protein Rab-36 isoform X4 [Mustela erminea]